MSVTRASENWFMLTFFAAHVAVAGINCINPIAPARDLASAMNLLSCLIRP